MDKLLLGISSAIMVAATVFVVSVLGGTIVFFLWPIAIPAAFPGLVEKGILATRLSWWAAVCLSWVFGTLIKSSSSTATKNKGE